MVECYRCEVRLQMCRAEKKKFSMEPDRVDEEAVDIIDEEVDDSGNVEVEAWFCLGCAGEMEGNNEIEEGA